MNPTLRERVIRHLDPLPDERVYQVLDYIEFLEAKYGPATAQSPNLLQRFSEGIEDTMRAGRVSTAAIAETMGLLSKAMGVLGGVAAAGKSVASEIVDAASRATATATSLVSGDDKAKVETPPSPPAPSKKNGEGQADGSPG